MENKKMPHKKKTCIMSYFWAWRIANAILSIFYSLNDYDYYKDKYININPVKANEAWTRLLKVFIAICFLNLLSCLQLAYTVYRINQIIKNHKLLN